MKRKKMTAKQRVLKRYPRAVAWASPGGWWTISTPDWAGRDLHKFSSRSAAKAWADAARNLKRSK